MFESVKAARRLPREALHTAINARGTIGTVEVLAADVHEILPIVKVTVFLVATAAMVYIGTRLGTYLHDAIYG